MYMLLLFTTTVIHAGNGDQNGDVLPDQWVQEARRLLLQTTLCSQAYPSFAVLPILRSQQMQHRSFCLFQFLPSQPMRQHSVQAPCFAARPLYSPSSRKVRVSLRVPYIVSAGNTGGSAALTPTLRQKRKLQAHPLYNYAGLHQYETATAPAAVSQKRSIACLQTYAVMAAPASQQSISQACNVRGTLRDFALLRGCATPAPGVRRPLSSPGATLKADRSALKQYAQLGRHS